MNHRYMGVHKERVYNKRGQDCGSPCTDNHTMCLKMCLTEFNAHLLGLRTKSFMLASNLAFGNSSNTTIPVLKEPPEAAILTSQANIEFSMAASGPMAYLSVLLARWTQMSEGTDSKPEPHSDT